MATMKDVARMAGVSHGTVSNVLNGTKGVSIDKIKKVEEAIKVLGYKPNALARNLKTTKAGKSIYVILPDMTDGTCREIFDGISRVAEQKNYRINLHIANEMIYKERQALSRAQMFNADGAVIMTCQPEDSEYFQGLAADGLNMVFVQREVRGRDFVGLDMKKRIEDSVAAQIAAGKNRIAIITGPREYSFESDCAEGYLKAMFVGGRAINNDYIRVAGFNKESGMRAAIRMLSTPERPEIIYVTSGIIAEGVRKALTMIVMDGEVMPRLIVVNSPLWTQVARDDEDEIAIPGGLIGEDAMHTVIDMIENPKSSAPKKIIIEKHGRGIVRDSGCHIHHTGESRCIKVMLQRGNIGNAVVLLSNDFRKKTGIDVKIDLKKYSEILDIIKSGTGDYDAFCVDIPWIKELVLGKHIENLEPFIDDRVSMMSAFQKNIFREYSLYENEIYALPYSYTVQMLYYRKDLFEKIKNKRLYFDMYKEELTVPTTWKEYNKVARFFTRRFNPESDTVYGTTLGGRKSTGSICEYLPRAWSFGGSFFDGDRMLVNNPGCIEALRNYVECFEYANPDSKDWWWEEEAAEFSKGSTAMMVLFSDHAPLLRDRNKSKVMGKTGYAAIPGEISTLGGWSIALSAASKHKEEAFEFLKWTACEDMSMPNAVLGRVLPYKSIYESPELASFYSWHRDSFKVFRRIGKRLMPADANGNILSEKYFEEIVGEAVYDAVTKKITAEQAVDAMAKKFTLLLKQ